MTEDLKVLIDEAYRTTPSVGGGKRVRMIRRLASALRVALDAERLDEKALFDQDGEQLDDLYFRGIGMPNASMEDGEDDTFVIRVSRAEFYEGRDDLLREIVVGDQENGFRFRRSERRTLVTLRDGDPK